MKSKIIAVVGAGGKTTLIKDLAEKYSFQGKRVCITTTTHIYKPTESTTESIVEGIFYNGIEEGEKLLYSGDEEFFRLSREYDIILVEADGSHHFPIKIPEKNEPVIPKKVNEIYVVMGLHALCRPIGEVCQRFETANKEIIMKEFPELDEKFPVNISIIDFIAENYYIKPLRKKFPDVEIKYVRNDFVKTRRAKVALILLASGISKRFGSENKMFYVINGKELFRHGADSLISAKKDLEKYGIEAEVFITGGNINEYCGVKILENPERYEGISSSIRLGTRAAIENRCEAVLFLAGDQAKFPSEDIVRLVREFLSSGKKCGCAYSKYPSNPGIFSKSMYEEIQELSGDFGAMRVIKRHPENTHYYVVKSEKLLDIDELNDTINF